MSGMFQTWDSADGVFRAGSILRCSSSNSKVWGEIVPDDQDLLAGTFVAVNENGGVKKLSSSEDIVHGIVVLDVYGEKSPHTTTINIGHFGYGDEVCALIVEGDDFARGDRAYIVASGDNAGRVTKEATNNLDLGYWVTQTSGNNVVGITLAPYQNVTLGG